MKTKIFLSYNLTQNIRFINALMESEHIAFIPADDELKFKELKRVFNAS